MADTIAELENAISTDIDAFEDRVNVFIDEIQNFATNQPFNVVNVADPFSDESTYRTGSAGQSFYDALVNTPVRPTSELEYNQPLDPGVAPGDFTLSEVDAPNVPNFADAAPVLNFPKIGRAHV